MYMRHIVQIHSWSDSNRAGFFSVKVVLMIAFLFLMVLGLGAGITIAKAGLVNIPVLSNALYEPYVPERVMGEDIAPLSFPDIMKQKTPFLLAQSTAIPTARFDEEELTALLRFYLAEANDVEQIRYPQLTLNEGTIQFFSELALERSTTTIRVDALAGYDGDQVYAHVAHVSVGGIPIPAPLVNMLLAPILQPRLSALEAQLHESAIASIRIHDRTLALELKRDMLDTLIQ